MKCESPCRKRTVSELVRSMPFLRRCVSILLGVLLCVFCSLAVAEEPPTPGQIVERMGELSKDKKYEELDSYIETLHKQHPSYVPAMCARMIHQYYEGAQAELLLEKVNALRNQLERYPAHFAPLFREINAAVAGTCEEQISEFEERGLTKEKRFQAFARERAGPMSLRFRLFIEGAPLISLPSNSDERVRSFSVMEQLPDIGTEKQSSKALFEQVVNSRLSLDKRRRACEQITLGDSAEAPKALAELLDYPDPWVECFAAEAVNGLGSSAIPIVLESLQDTYSSRKRNAIYALMRIDQDTPDVIDALQKETTNKLSLSSVRAYAKEAIKHLQRDKKHASK